MFPSSLSVYTPIDWASKEPLIKISLSLRKGREAVAHKKVEDSGKGIEWNSSSKDRATTAIAGAKLRSMASIVKKDPWSHHEFDKRTKRRRRIRRRVHKIVGIIIKGKMWCNKEKINKKRTILGSRLMATRWFVPHFAFRENLGKKNLFFYLICCCYPDKWGQQRRWSDQLPTSNHEYFPFSAFLGSEIPFVSLPSISEWRMQNICIMFLFVFPFFVTYFFFSCLCWRTERSEEDPMNPSSINMDTYGNAHLQLFFSERLDLKKFGNALSAGEAGVYNSGANLNDSQNWSERKNTRNPSSFDPASSRRILSDKKMFWREKKKIKSNK